MIRNKKPIFSFWLLALFVTYQVSISMFTHVHYIDGVMVTHSHPFKGKHSHTSTSTVAISRLSALQALETAVYFDLTPVWRTLCVFQANHTAPIPALFNGAGPTLRGPPFHIWD